MTRAEGTAPSAPSPIPYLLILDRRLMGAQNLLIGSRPMALLSLAMPLQVVKRH